MIIDGDTYIETLKDLMLKGHKVNLMSYSIYGDIDDILGLISKTNSRIIISVPPYFPCNKNGCQDCFDSYIDNLEDIFTKLDNYNINAKITTKVHGKMFYADLGNEFIYSLGSKNVYKSRSLDISFVNMAQKDDEDLKSLIEIFNNEWEKEQVVSFGKYNGEKISEVVKNEDYFKNLHNIGLDKILANYLPLLMFLNLRYKNGENLYL